MFIRIATVRKGNKTYEYAQLAQSYRGEDGRPSTRILANLGRVDTQQVERLEAAIAALRHGKAGVVPESPGSSSDGKPEILANRRYLDLAVLHRLWHEIGLDEIVSRALPAEERQVSVEAVVAALVLQRCVSPTSKLAAEAWYETTALPELQGISPASFNNSRIHRALSALDKAEADIQAALPVAIGRSEGNFTTLFIDATDTWFVGTGPEIAHKGRDKEGLYRRRIGLVMLCDQSGFPLRWHTLDGKFHDPTSLAEMAEEASKLPWTQGVPLVMDRAAGHAGATQALHELGVHYVTALPDSELISSGVPIPWNVLDSLQAEREAGPITAKLEQGGFARQGPRRYLLDLGIFEKARSNSGGVAFAIGVLERLEKLDALPGLGPTEVAQRLGWSRPVVYRYLPLKGLCHGARQRLRNGESDRLGMAELLTVAGLPADEQTAAIEAFQARSDLQRHHVKRTGQRGYDARAVLSINPERFLEDRRKDEENVATVERAVSDVNRRLARKSNRRTDASALAEVQEVIRRYGLSTVLSLELQRSDDGRREIRISQVPGAWRARRRGDGISVILAHPKVAGDAAELVERYFAKDAIEKDFQTIKSVVELRPIHHRTDPKVRAHVTLCVLALLLLRGLRRRLTEESAEQGLAKLEEVRLNQLAGRSVTYYLLTRPTAEAERILKKLGYTDLIDARHLEALLRPR